ncbi:hypothetical protein ASG29_00720 [Sphingomonas sp. Leaf412]|nr:hypothetical protein ASG29_00720 [Sphingomonas sp. Leaf412]
MLARWRRPAPPLRLASVARTHVGRVRTVNEDRLLDRPDRGLWAIADGMGGHSAGDVAAQTAVAALAALADDDARITAATIATALHDAGARIAAGPAPGGTTIVALHLDGTTATVIWAGDSRCYLLRDGACRQLTRDHSVVQELVDAGLLDPADAARHPRGHVITRALGVQPAPDLARVTVEVRAGDALFLCSDGASRALVDRDFLPREPLDTAADRLLTAALQRDGSDNISLILVSLPDAAA